MDVREKLVDLKPCPCCGGEARHYFSNPNGMHLSNVGGVSWGCNLDHHVIRCYKCGLRTRVYATAKGCYKAWNSRAGEEDKHEAL